MGILRLLLALAVLSSHLGHGRGICGFSLLEGKYAVECFFIISGFYMALVLNEKYNFKGSYWIFMLQRFLRLYPLYLAVGLLILAVEGIITYTTSRPCGVFHAWSQAQHIPFLAACYYCLVNVTILAQDSLWFVSQDHLTGQFFLTPYPRAYQDYCFFYLVNVPTWTLAVEMSFYLVAPFLVRKSVKIQAAFLLVSFALRWAFYLALGAKSSPWIFYFSPSCLFFFMAGSLGYHFYQKRREEFETFARSHIWIFWIFCAFIVVEGRLPYRDYFPYFFIPTAIFVVPLLFALTSRNKRDRFIGELSYPYYLIHYNVIAVTDFFLQRTYDALFGPICLIVTFVLTYILYQVIETRTEHYREHLFQKMDSSKKLQVIESKNL